MTTSDFIYISPYYRYTSSDHFSTTRLAKPRSGCGDNNSRRYSSISYTGNRRRILTMVRTIRYNILFIFRYQSIFNFRLNILYGNIQFSTTGNRHTAPRATVNFSSTRISSGLVYSIYYRTSDASDDGGHNCRHCIHVHIIISIYNCALIELFGAPMR